MTCDGLKKCSSPSSMCIFRNPDNSRRTRVTKWLSSALTASHRAAQYLAAQGEDPVISSLRGIYSLIVAQNPLATRLWAPQLMRNRLILSVRPSNCVEHSLASTLYLSIACSTALVCTDRQRVHHTTMVQPRSARCAGSSGYQTDENAKH